MDPQEIIQALQELGDRIGELEARPDVPDHRHTGLDSIRVREDDIKERRHYEGITLHGADAATAANYDVFFIAPFDCIIGAVWETHTTEGSDGSDVGLNIEKLADGDALDAGTELLEEDIDLKATADTVQEGEITATRTDRTISKGERLALKDSGTLTAVANVSVMVELEVV